MYALFFFLVTMDCFIWGSLHPLPYQRHHRHHSIYEKWFVSFRVQKSGLLGRNLLKYLTFLSTLAFTMVENRRSLKGCFLLNFKFYTSHHDESELDTSRTHILLLKVEISNVLVEDIAEYKSVKRQSNSYK